MHKSLPPLPPPHPKKKEKKEKKEREEVKTTTFWIQSSSYSAPKDLGKGLHIY